MRSVIGITFLALIAQAAEQAANNTAAADDDADLDHSAGEHVLETARPRIPINGRDFRQRPRFSPTSEIFANGRDFRKRPRFSRTAEIFANGRDFRQRNGRTRIGRTRKKNHFFAAAIAAAKKCKKRPYTTKTKRLIDGPLKRPIDQTPKTLRGAHP